MQLIATTDSLDGSPTILLISAQIMDAGVDAFGFEIVNPWQLEDDQVAVADDSADPLPSRQDIHKVCGWGPSTGLPRSKSSGANPYLPLVASPEWSSIPLLLSHLPSVCLRSK